MKISHPSIKKLLWLVKHPGFKQNPLRTLIQVISWEGIRMAGKPVPFLYDNSLSVLLYPNDGVARLVFYFNYHELAEFTFLNRYLNKDMICIDVGANIGMYSLFMAKRVKHVIAFEPQTESITRLLESTTGNHLLNITAVQNAVSSQRGKLKLSFVDNDSAKVFTSSNLNTSDMQNTVDAISLDEYFNINPVERIDYLKIDAEGAEADVLLGAKKILNKYKPIVQIEIAPPIQARTEKVEGRQAFNFDQFFENLEYQFYYIDTKTNLLKKGKSWNTIAINKQKVLELQNARIIEA